MLVHAGFVFTYTPVAAGPLKGQDARKVLLEADRLFSKKGVSLSHGRWYSFGAPDTVL